jgi:hypothetical protein
MEIAFGNLLAIGLHVEEPLDNAVSQPRGVVGGYFGTQAKAVFLVADCKADRAGDDVVLRA